MGTTKDPTVEKGIPELRGFLEKSAVPRDGIQGFLHPLVPFAVQEMANHFVLYRCVWLLFHLVVCLLYKYFGGRVVYLLYASVDDVMEALHVPHPW